MSANILQRIRQEDPPLMIKRLIHIFPFLFAVSTLILLIWSVYLVISYPYDGFVADTRTGIINYVDPSGPVSGILIVDDKLFPYNQKYYNYGLINVQIVGHSNLIELNILRGDKPLLVRFQLAAPPLREIFNRLIPLIVALIFFLVGLTVLAYRQATAIVNLFFYTTQVGGLALILGTLRLHGLTSLDAIFFSSILIVGPIAVHFHLWFLDIRKHTAMRIIIGSLYIFSLLTILFLIIRNRSTTNLIIISDRLSFFVSSFLVLNLTAIAIILIFKYFLTKEKKENGIIRVISFGGILGLLPISLFSITPNILIGKPILPFYNAFLMLSIIPLTYGYILLKPIGNLNEDKVSRPAKSVMVHAILFGMYYLLLAIIGILVRIDYSEYPTFFTVLVFLLGSTYQLSRRTIEKIVSNLLLGSWYDYRSVVISTTEQLSYTRDRDRLSDQILAIIKSMHFRGGLLYLTNRNKLYFHGKFGFEEVIDPNESISLNNYLTHYLVSGHDPIWREKILSEIEFDKLDVFLQDLLNLSGNILWVPLVTGRNLRGLLILRLRFGKEWMSQEDIDILKTIAALIAIASENVGLLEELREQLASLEEARADLVESRKSLAEGREHERLHIARELHDGPIQDLYAFRLKFGNLDSTGIGESIDEMNQRILNVIHELRDLCMLLRPPVLAYFGFEPAVRSLVNKFTIDYPGINVFMNVQKGGPVLGDPQKIALYRILQEALNNVGQHSKADEVNIYYMIENGSVTLEVMDNGLGFSVPSRWVEFARNGHLGLLGMSERAESFGGNLEIQSTPGNGTLLRVTAPHTEREVLVRAISN